MKHSTLLVTVASLMLIALAQSATAADCSNARDPRRCEAMRAAREACSDLQGQARSACLREALPPPDCSRAPNVVDCQTKQAAKAACKDKHGAAHRRCLKEQLRAG